jgi:predicted deacylase
VANPKTTAKTPARPPLEIGGQSIAPGTRRVVDLPLSMMSDHTPASLSLQVIHGRREGPTVFVSAAIHGDEIIGVEIVRRLMRASALKRMAGTLLLIPIVNTFGFINHSRYLPDRRDLNRSFPGSAGGSLAGRLAHLFSTEVLARSDVGIDLHSAAVNRINLPQIRVDTANARAMELASAFSPPVIVNSTLRDGSLREAASERGIPVMVFEAGEGLRFDETAIRIGVRGTLDVLRHLGMITRKPTSRSFRPVPKAPVATRTFWVRSAEGGVVRTHCTIGQYVTKGALLGVVSDPFGERDTDILSPHAGLIIGRSNLPIVNEGDALVHIASVPKAAAARADLDTLEEAFDGDPLFDEDEIL